LGRTAAEPVVRGYVDHLNRILNRTVSDSRLTALRDSRVEGSRFVVCRYESGVTRPIELHGTSAHLLIQQTIDVAGDHCETVSYHYRFQQAEASKSWLFRWEWFRKPPKPDYPYPLAHFHVNARLTADDRDVSGLHFPSARVAIEQVVWGLVAEWGVTTKTEDWREILTESLEGFEERRRSL
jgi:hypothetical protein